MLNIWYRGGDIKVMTDAPDYFDVAFKPEWFEDDLVKKMIKDVDKSDVIGPYLIISPVLGPIAPTYLSGGVKVLILLLKEPKFIYNLSNCGDNCAKWILEICKDKDIVAYLEHVMHFKDPFDIKVLNTGNVVHRMQDLIPELRESNNLVVVLINKLHWQQSQWSFIMASQALRSALAKKILTGRYGSAKSRF